MVLETRVTENFIVNVATGNTVLETRVTENFKANATTGNADDAILASSSKDDDKREPADSDSDSEGGSTGFSDFLVFLKTPTKKDEETTTTLPPVVEVKATVAPGNDAFVDARAPIHPRQWKAVPVAVAEPAKEAKVEAVVREARRRRRGAARGPTLGRADVRGDEAKSTASRTPVHPRQWKAVRLSRREVLVQSEAKELSEKVFAATVIQSQVRAWKCQKELFSIIEPLERTCLARATAAIFIQSMARSSSQQSFLEMREQAQDIGAEETSAGAGAAPAPAAKPALGHVSAVERGAERAAASAEKEAGVEAVVREDDVADAAKRAESVDRGAANAADAEETSAGAGAVDRVDAAPAPAAKPAPERPAARPEPEPKPSSASTVFSDDTSVTASIASNFSIRPDASVAARYFTEKAAVEKLATTAEARRLPLNGSLRRRTFPNWGR